MSDTQLSRAMNAVAFLQLGFGETLFRTLNTYLESRAMVETVGSLTTSPSDGPANRIGAVATELDNVDLPADLRHNSGKSSPWWVGHDGGQASPPAEPTR